MSAKADPEKYYSPKIRQCVSVVTSKMQHTLDKKEFKTKKYVIKYIIKNTPKMMISVKLYLHCQL